METTDRHGRVIAPLEPRRLLSTCDVISSYMVSQRCDTECYVEAGEIETETKRIESLIVGAQGGGTSALHKGRKFYRIGLNITRLQIFLLRRHGRGDTQISVDARDAPITHALLKERAEETASVCLFALK